MTEKVLAQDNIVRARDLEGSRDAGECARGRAGRRGLGAQAPTADLSHSAVPIPGHSEWEINVLTSRGGFQSSVFKTYSTIANTLTPMWHRDPKLWALV